MGLDKDKRITTVNGIQYRLVRIIDKTEEDIHHIIGLSLKNEGYDVQNPTNKIKINRRKHIALNNFFGQNQAAHLQLKQCLEIREPVLSDGVRNALYEILSLPKDSFYKEELVRKKQKGKPLFNGELNEQLKLNV